MLRSFLDGVTGMRIAIAVASAHGEATDGAGIQSLVSQYQPWFTAFQRTLFHSPQAAVALKAPAAPASSSGGMAGILSLVMAGQVVFFAFYTGAYTMMSILHEQEDGALARLFSTPTPRTVILTGKFMAVALTVLVQSLVLLGIGFLAFRIRWGDPLSVALVLVGQVAAASGLGVLIIALVKSTRQGGPVLGGLLTVLGMLGGLFTVAAAGVPAGLDATWRFTPQGWVLHGWKLALGGSPARETLLPVLVMLALGVVMFVGGAVLFRRRFA